MSVIRKTYKFRTVALNQTSMWHGLPDGCVKVFGLYFFCEGEGTHLCSLIPSSRISFLQNYFIGVPSEHEFVEENEYLGEDDTYTRFIDVEDPAWAKFISDPIEVTLEWTAEELEAFDGSKEDFEAQYRETAWEEAREYLQGNSREPRCLFLGE